MSGKVYTMKEMKSIVTYLTEHQAYGEIRGRKMWVDFANTNATTRTWQSLKETFLKRILPDIHNPYYNLSREQIISFRQGYDVEQRDKNKLEIQPVGDGSNSNTEINKDNEPEVISSGDETMLQGENDKVSNVSKSIVEQKDCYKTIDDLRRDLESPMIDEEKKLTHSNLEEIPPAIQSVINEFASDSEDVQKTNKSVTTENKDKNDLDSSKSNHVDNSNSDPGIQDINSDQIDVKKEIDNSPPKPAQIEDTGNNGNNKNENAETMAAEPGNEKVVDRETSHDILEISSVNNAGDTSLNKINMNQETAATSMASSCQPLTNSTSDTILPNNQEGLEVQSHNKEVLGTTDSKTSKSKPIRKRSSSAETIIIENKRQKTNSISNTSEKKSAPDGNENEPQVFNVNDSDNDTSTEVNKAGATNINSEKSDDEVQPSENPCLKSVSLYAEQFNKTKYSDSTSDDHKTKKKYAKPSGSKEVENESKQVKDDVVVLKSHSESDTGDKSPKIRRRVSKRVDEVVRKKKAIANVFGFNSGAVSSSRNRKLSQNQVRRAQNVPHARDDTDSDSSEWTTDTEHDNFVSPPRGRKNRPTKKYMKPKSARILSLEEEGGLFVMYGKRIYPIVKDGRIIKNYVIYESNSDSGFEQDSYWKAKYAELKKKYEENRKSKEPSERLRERKSRSASKEPSSPILQSNIRKNQPTAQNHDIHVPSTSNTHPVIDKKEVTEQPVEHKTATDKIMIKYTINNAEVQLEGHWPQICPIFDKVLDILPRKTEPQSEVKSKNLEVQEQPNVISSGESTPIIITRDPVVEEKIDKIESEIFKEIEEKDKEEIEKDIQENASKVNTRKRGRPIQQSTSPRSPNNPNKQPKPSTTKKVSTTRDDKITTESTEKQSNTQQSPQIVTRGTRRSMKAALDEHKETKPTRGTPKQSNVTKGIEEEDFLYKFPANTPQTTSNKIQRPKSSADRIVFKDDDSLLASESTQGYQDSDISPENFKQKRKSKRSSFAYRNKLQTKRNQRRSYPYLLQDASTDSNSSHSSKSKTSQSSSEIYKSDSYQYLFPHTKKKFDRLEPINEASPTANEVEMRPFDAVCRNQLNTDSMDSDTLINGNTGMGSSSNVSLPQSPELSIVEDISIGKELLNSIREYHSLKNTQANEVIMNEEQNKYMMTEVDISIPLMDQLSVLHKSNADVVMKNVSNKSNRQKKPSVSESLLNKICTVNINDNSSVSDSLDIQLRNLLLESAKKMRRRTQSKENMEIDQNSLNAMQKSIAKKRCSTPRKKKEMVNPKILTTKSTIEQHLEACSYRGRKSCPPSIQIQEENFINNSEILNDTLEYGKNKPKGRKNKKDIIKVKILRPRNKSVPKEVSEKLTHKSSRLSVCTDSGINGTESGISFPISNDTVELIHNHSETCLHANECLENSVEFVDTSMAFISVNSSSVTTEWQDSREFKDADSMSLCSLNNNVKGVDSCNNVECIRTYTNENKRETICRSPVNNDIANSSLITEDLSDEAPVQSRVPPLPSGWYLLSEDECTNTNFVATSNSNTGGFGANLNQIFPLICAVPNLSTITEMSKDNDSRKPMGLDSFTKDSDSQNIFM